MTRTPAMPRTETPDILDRIAHGLVESAKHAPWLSSALDAHPDGIILVDSNGEFVYFNQAATDILGFGPTPTTASEWQAQYGVFEEDGITPVATEDLPLVCALRGKWSASAYS